MDNLTFERDAGADTRAGTWAGAALVLALLVLTLVAVSVAGVDAAADRHRGAAIRDLDELPLGRPGRKF